MRQNTTRLTGSRSASCKGLEELVRDHAAVLHSLSLALRVLPGSARRRVDLTMLDYGDDDLALAFLSL